jgi:hypothetical protein
MRPLIAVALLLAPVPAIAQAQTTGDETRAALHQLQAEDARLQSLGWKLARANAPFCKAVQPSIGLLLADVQNFARPAAIRKALAIGGDISVAAVAAGSPAESSGLRSGDEVLAIGGKPTAQLPKVPANDYARLEGLHGAIETALAAGGSIAIETAPPRGTLTIAAQPVCRSRFELIDDAGHAGADGSRVRIGRAILGENAEEAQAAALVAHELAHNILSHRARLAVLGRTSGAIRDTEREADRLSVWLVANAGYDPQAAIRFMASWGRLHDKGLFRAPTHDGWRARAALMEAELAKLQAVMAGGAGLPLDWRPHFPAP